VNTTVRSTEESFVSSSLTYSNYTLPTRELNLRENFTLNFEEGTLPSDLSKVRPWYVNNRGEMDTVILEIVSSTATSIEI